MQTEPNSDDEISNDDIVGKALAISAAIVVVVLIGAGAYWVLRGQSEEELLPEDTPTILPEVRALPELRIPRIPFTDVSKESGLVFSHTNGADGEKLLPETMGGGGAIFDFDNDGDQDILCVNSTYWPWDAYRPKDSPTCALFENDGSGKFTNITEGSGLDFEIYGNGVACGDFNGDGLVDIYLTAVGENCLLQNLGDGKFQDVTSASKTSGPADGWSTSAGFFDYDRDGDLDLAVCNYIEWSREKDLSMEFTLDGSLRAYGRPADFRGAFPILFRNDGDTGFTDVSKEAGLQVTNPATGEPLAKSLGITFPDANSDGWLDMMIANDTVQNLLFMNQKNGSFQESAATAGVAFDNRGQARGAMGIDSACFRNTDSLGITIGNFANEMTAMYVCQTPGLPMPVFRDEAVSNGIGPITRTELTFGVLFADVDLDGRLDLIACNGHLEEDIQKVQASQSYQQPAQLLWNCGAEYENEFMVAGEAEVGNDFLKPMVGRGACRGDIDGDGDLDLLFLSSGGPARLLRNDQETNHNWLRLSLNGKAGNKQAIGATATVTLSNGQSLRRTVMPTCSYQSQSELPVTFGLGEDTSIESLTIAWPDGSESTHTISEVNKMVVVRQL